MQEMRIKLHMLSGKTVNQHLLRLLETKTRAKRNVNKLALLQESNITVSYS
jgi:hypothetical protein